MSKLTEDKVYRVIEDSKEIFYDSEAPSEYKDILRDIKPFVLFSESGPKIFGRAYLVHSRQFEAIDNELKTSVPYFMYQGRMSWAILELNFSVINKASKEELCDTISHELAHLLEFMINGYYDRKHWRYHNKDWKAIHRWMGGSALAVI